MRLNEKAKPFLVHVYILCMHACGLCNGDNMFPLKVELNCCSEDYETLVCFY
jgi:hypothetical protein